jgi:predicted SprT family Zn-dependent metalloprotease
MGKLLLLQETLNQVNDSYFHYEKLPIIKLSKGQDKAKRRAIIFGTYHAKKDEIKIHPVLLQEHLPSFVLEFVIYHEMLHYQDRELLLIRKKGDKVHTKEFRQREKQFLHYEEAQKILKNILYGKDMHEESTPNTPAENANSSKNNTKKIVRKVLKGEELENALTESLQRLDHILIKYNLKEEKIKGAKRGTKKTNDESQLASNE